MGDWLATVDADDTAVLLAILDAVGSSSGPAKPPVHRSMNRSRERRRRELLLLRDEARVLSSQLEELQARHAAAAAREQRAAASRELRALPLWERLATSQRQARQRAEATNAELKRHLMCQRDELCRLRRAVAELYRGNEGMGGDTARACIPTNIRARMPLVTQQSRLQLMGPKWWAKFSTSNGFAVDVNEFRSVKIVPSTDELVVQASSSHAIPFAIQRVEEALWSFLGIEVDQDEEEIITREATSTDTTMYGVTVSMFSQGHARGRMDAAFAVERFHPTNENTSVVVYTAFGETRGFSDVIDGVTHNQDIWLRLVQSTDAITATPITVVQHVRDVRVTLAQCEESRMGEIAAFMDEQIRDEIHWAQRALENLLLTKPRDDPCREGNQKSGDAR